MTLKTIVCDNNDVWFKDIEKEGYDVVVSVGEYEENRIGSNCGQYVSTYLNKKRELSDSYLYKLKAINQEITKSDV